MKLFFKKKKKKLMNDIKFQVIRGVKFQFAISQQFWKFLKLKNLKINIKRKYKFAKEILCLI